jgi:AcrR family transcriptional regulator
MDDVARELGISKKTLYLFVDNKDDLVDKVMERHIQEDCGVWDALHNQSADALDEIFKVVQYNAQDLGKMKTNIIFELQRYYPETWAKIQNYTWDFLYKVVVGNLEWGIRDGIYRDDFNPEIIARLHIASSLHLFDERTFPVPPYSHETLFKEFMIHYLRGILSEKGLIKLKAKLS